MASLVVRVYNVRFGDAILISVPDEDEGGAPKTRHILIDVGNAASKEGGENEVFEPTIRSILDILDDQPLDLYVVTHEHMDHVQGLLWASRFMLQNDELKERLQVQHTWMPASAHPEYYDTHENAKRKLVEATEAYETTASFLAAAPDAENELIRTLMRNNNRFLARTADGLPLSHGKTADCVEYLRGLAGEDRTHYVHRSVSTDNTEEGLLDLGGTHPFRKAKLKILAPEEDSSVYYGRFKPAALGMVAAADAEAGAPAELPKPPPGVDCGAFYNLVELRRSGMMDNLLAIDKAANNSSIVFSLDWQGWKLLFPGDAEIRSWKEMNKRGVLEPAHFLKISHHGSHNGTPGLEILEKVFPPVDGDPGVRHAVQSTYPNTYSGIPDDETVAELRKDHGCTIHSTLDMDDGEPLVIEFEGHAQ